MKTSRSNILIVLLVVALIGGIGVYYLAIPAGQGVANTPAPETEEPDGPVAGAANGGELRMQVRPPKPVPGEVKSTSQPDGEDQREVAVLLEATASDRIFKVGIYNLRGELLATLDAKPGTEVKTKLPGNVSLKPKLLDEVAVCNWDNDSFEAHPDGKDHLFTGRVTIGVGLEIRFLLEQGLPDSALDALSIALGDAQKDEALLVSWPSSFGTVFRGGASNGVISPVILPPTTAEQQVGIFVMGPDIEPVDRTFTAPSEGEVGLLEVPIRSRPRGLELTSVVRVVDEAGRPIEGASVSTTDYLEDIPGLAGGHLGAAITDANGIAEIPLEGEYEEGGETAVRVRAEGYESRYAVLKFSADPRTEHQIELKEAGNVLLGSVVTMDGTPVGSVRVRWRPMGLVKHAISTQEERFAITDPSGRFVMTGLPNAPGDVRIDDPAVYRSGKRHRLAALESGFEWEITLVAEPVPGVECILEDRDPDAAYLFRLNGVHPHTSDDSIWSASNWDYAVKWTLDLSDPVYGSLNNRGSTGRLYLSPGRYRICVWDSVSKAELVHEFEVGPDERERTEYLRLEPVRDLALTVNARFDGDAGLCEAAGIFVFPGQLNAAELVAAANGCEYAWWKAWSKVEPDRDPRQLSWDELVEGVVNPEKRLDYVRALERQLDRLVANDRYGRTLLLPSPATTDASGRTAVKVRGEIAFCTLYSPLHGLHHIQLADTSGSVTLDLTSAGCSSITVENVASSANVRPTIKLAVTDDWLTSQAVFIPIPSDEDIEDGVSKYRIPPITPCQALAHFGGDAIEYHSQVEMFNGKPHAVISRDGRQYDVHVVRK